MNKGKQSYLIAALTFLVILFISLIILYSNKLIFSNKDDQPAFVSNNLSPSKPPTNPEPQKGQLNYKEPVTKVAIGTEGLTKGLFLNTENNEVNLKSGEEEITKLSLSPDEIALTCTKQDLSTATELDFNQVTKVEVVKPDQLSSKINTDQLIVVIAENRKGINVVHTIALPEVNCNQ